MTLDIPARYGSAISKLYDKLTNKLTNVFAVWKPTTFAQILWE